MPRKYQLPDFLLEVITQPAYEKWLQRKAQAHYRRDKKRGNTTATGAKYKMAIHEAVKECGGKDAYTQEELDWHLLSTYNNDKSKEEGRAVYVR